MNSKSVLVARLFWICLGIACALWIELELVPRSQFPGLLHLVAGLVVLGGIARGGRRRKKVMWLPMCPACRFWAGDVPRSYPPEYVVRCRECDQVSCGVCGKRSFWRGAQCPRCGSHSVELIARIKRPEPDDFWKDPDDG